MASGSVVPGNTYTNNIEGGIVFGGRSGRLLIRLTAASSMIVTGTSTGQRGAPGVEEIKQHPSEMMEEAA